MRFFVDQCVSYSTVRFLESKGYDPILLKNHLPTDAPDDQDIAKAQRLDAVLLSLNGDFTDIVSYPPAAYKGIIGLQVKNRPEVLDQIHQRLGKYLKAHPQQHHYIGKLLLVQPHRLRVRQ